MTDALTLLSTRRSIPPLFLGEPGPDEAQLKTLLTIASRVPDHGKLAPWRYILFRGDARRRAGEKLAALAAARDPALSEQRLEDERNRLARAPRRRRGRQPRGRAREDSDLGAAALRRRLRHDAGDRGPRHGLRGELADRVAGL